MPGITLWNLSPTLHIHWRPCSLFYFDFCFLAWLLGFALCLLSLALKPAEFPSVGGSLCGCEQGGHGSQCFGSLPCVCVCVPYSSRFPKYTCLASSRPPWRPHWAHLCSLTSRIFLLEFWLVLRSGTRPATPPSPGQQRCKLFCVSSVALPDFQNLCPGTSPALHSEHKALGGRVPPW